MYDFIFRFDANKTTGAGHFQRINALIQRLISKQLRIACVGNISEDFQGILLNYQIDILPHGFSAECTCLVIDHYGAFDDLLGQGITYSGLIIFEDLDERSLNQPALVINALGQQNDLQKRYPQANVFTGLEYLVFRQELVELKNIDLAKAKNDEQINILISLGGTDQSQTIQRICSVLGEILSEYDAQDVRQKSAVNSVRPQEPILVTVMSNAELSLANNFNVELGYDPAFIEKASKYDLVICGAGQTFLELSYLALDPVAIVLAENQKNCAALLSSYGARTLVLDEDFDMQLLHLLRKRLSKKRSILKKNKLNPILSELMASASDTLIAKMVEYIK